MARPAAGSGTSHDVAPSPLRVAAMAASLAEVGIGAQPHEDGDANEDLEERMLLVRAEAEAARQLSLRRGQAAPPLVEDYGHMPVPSMLGLRSISQ